MTSFTSTPSAAIVELFGEKLLSGKTSVDTKEALSNKRAIGVYFSAHWCPPCRGFTPKLAEWYTKDLKAAGLEIVFVSSDRDEKAFEEYFAEMPFLALPYAERELKNKLSKKFKVRGIPSFVILDPESGAVITLDGRSAVSGDPKGENLPWKPKTFAEIMEEAKFVNKEKKSIKYEDLKQYEAVGFYFSAHWCPPCKMFTPELVKAYNEVNKDGKKFEIVFLSCDRDEPAFDSYWGEMPWMACGYADKALNQALSDHFDCNGIPHLVIVDPKTSEVINANATGKLRGAGSVEEKAKSFPWAPESVKELDSDPEGIDEGLSLILLQENVEESKKNEYKNALKEVASKWKKLGDSELNFFTASKQGRLADRVRDECACGKAAADDTVTDTSSKDGDEKGAAVAEMKSGAKVVMMNIPEEEYYNFEYADVTVENVEKFFKDFSAGKLKAKPMGA